MKKRFFLPLCATVLVLTLLLAALPVFAVENDFSGRYNINIQLKQFGSEDLSMGNASMISPATLVISGGAAHIEIHMQPLMYLGKEGYLASLKKVTKIVEKNKYNYPTKIETEDAAVLEEFTDVYDIFNSPGSQYLDDNVAGKWYPKTLSMPVSVNTDGDALTGEDDIFVQVYVPVMESIMKGSGTKFARLMVDYSSIEKIGEIETTAPAEVTTVPENTIAAEETITQTVPETSVVPATEATETKLDRYHLADGEYVVNGNMVKIDRETPSMSDNAINHKILLSVRGGKYYLTMKFRGINIGDKFGYLGKLRYFLTGYTSDSYGKPNGDTAPVTVKSYHLGADGKNLVDSYGTDYPNEVEFEMIPEALDDTYVPLQVFVPVMESISEGGGTQPVFLTLNWKTLQQATSENTKEDATSSTEQATTVPKGLANKTLTAEPGSTLKSSGAIQTGEKNSWTATLLLFISILIPTGIFIYRKKNNSNTQ